MTATVQTRVMTMAEPASASLTGAALAFALGGALADVVQGLDSYISLVDPAEGCKLESEPFVLRRPAATTPEPPADKNKKLRPGGGGTEADKSRELRAEGHSPSAGPAAVPPQQRSSEDPKLLSVSSVPWTRKSPDPVVTISLASMSTTRFAVCAPYISELHGFDSRLGHQANIKCQAVTVLELEHAAVLVSQVLFNPYTQESGFITLWHTVVLDKDGNVHVTYQEKKTKSVPDKAFTVANYGGFTVRISPR
jgi:hypothetical protein